jgi:hypothetical protein
MGKWRRDRKAKLDTPDQGTGSVGGIKLGTVKEKMAIYAIENKKNIGKFCFKLASPNHSKCSIWADT